MKLKLKIYIPIIKNNYNKSRMKYQIENIKLRNQSNNYLITKLKWNNDQNIFKRKKRNQIL